MKKNIRMLLLGRLFCLSSCGKKFLDIKRDKAQVVPSKIQDFQGMLDNRTVMNDYSSYELSIIGSDEYQLSDNVWQSLGDPFEKNGYIWADDVYERRSLRDWDEAYHRILVANMALEGIEKISPNDNEQTEWENVKGSALFFRAINHYQLAQLFCKPYNANTAKTDMGIPVRIESDITLKVGRGDLQSLYDLIINDLKKSIDLLPEKPLVKYRPSKSATYALLARVYLQMADYKNAGFYSNKALQINSELIDFNKIDVNAVYPFPIDQELNPEILFFSNIPNIAIVTSSRFDVDINLLLSYSDSDLRRQIYYNKHDSGRYLFKGSYRGVPACFTGIAIDEVLLTRAESYARENYLALAMEDLNRLLINRYDKETFKPRVVNSSEEALGLILDERRKELVLRGIRWEDLRRLNQDPRFEKTLTRMVEGKFYELVPNSNRYVWPIPDNEIDLSGLKQNSRSQ